MEPYVITHSFIFNKKISRYLPGGEHSNFFHDTSNRLHFRQIRGSRCVDLDGNEYAIHDIIFMINIKKLS